MRLSNHRWRSDGRRGLEVACPGMLALWIGWSHRAAHHAERDGYIDEGRFPLTAFFTQPSKTGLSHFIHLPRRFDAPRRNPSFHATRVKGLALQTAGIVAVMGWEQGPCSPFVLTHLRRMLAVLPPSSLLNLMSSGVRVLKATKR